MKIRKEAGVTLIELVIVVAIIATLAAIAYPSYTEHVLRARRAGCEGAMMSTAALLERKHSVMNQYTGSGLSLPDQWPDAGTKFYDVKYTIAGSSFTITATPVAVQSADKCGVLSLTHTGAKGASGTLGTDACW